MIPMRKKDIYFIMKWRNDQIEILRQNKTLTKKDQLSYYQNYILPSFFQKKPTLILFSYLLNNRLIGYGGLTNIDWRSKKAEISFLLNTKRAKDKIAYQQEFMVFLKLIKQIAFKDLKLKLIFTETYDIRPWHVATLEQNGFISKRRIKKHVYKKGKNIDSLIHECAEKL